MTLAVLAAWSGFAPLLAAFFAYRVGRRHGFESGARRVVHINGSSFTMQIHQPGEIAEGEALSVRGSPQGGVR